MLKQLFVYTQYILPKYLLSILVGSLADSRNTWVKNQFIKRFINTYPVDMREALVENPQEYPSFNCFFTRELKAHLRPIAKEAIDIACPCDGTLAQVGSINKNKLLQAKQFYFDLNSLLASDEEAARFNNGTFATFYLAPHNYHRVHMPLDGTLIQTTFVPGKLFSVNRMTSELIPNLYARNERFISIFETSAGRMAVILVGAMIVGSIKTVWMDTPVRQNKIYSETFQNKIILTKGSELAQFRLGSTVILLFESNKVELSSSLILNNHVKFGQYLGKILI